jgi:hypothetical protein
MTTRRKKSTSTKDHRWSITRITGTPAAFLGHVYAPDEKTALQRAAEEFQVQPGLRNRLVAQREDG